jgi:hypothetical protein
MLTSFSLTQLILISAVYLTTLFGVAWITERGYVPRRLVRHPLVYTLSLQRKLCRSQSYKRSR